MTDISAFNMIYESLVATFVEYCRNKPDDLKVSTIRGGLLQDDPTKLVGLNILINHSSEGGKLMNMAKANREDHFLASPHYIGGALTTENVYAIRGLFHFKLQNRDEARRNANVIYSRMLNAINMSDLPTNPSTGLTRDDFGTVIIGKEIFDYRFEEKGGTGQFIWDGLIRVKFFLESKNSFSGD